MKILKWVMIVVLFVGLIAGALTGVRVLRYSALNVSARALTVRKAHADRAKEESQHFASKIHEAEALAYLPTANVQELLDTCLLGAKSVYHGLDGKMQGMTLEITRAKVRPATGEMKVLLAVHASRGLMQADVVVEANLLFEGVKETGDERLVQLSILPTTVAAESSVIGLSFSAKSFVSDLLAQLAVNGIGDLPNVSIPLPASMPISLGAVNVNEQQPIALGKGSMVLSGGLPAVTTNLALPYAGVVFAPQGMLIVAVDKETLTKPAPVEKATEGLAQLLRDCPFELADKASLFVGRRGIDLMGSQLSAIAPTAVDLHIKNSTGRLGEVTAWRDDLLGTGGGYAELANWDQALIHTQVAPFALKAQDGGLLVSTHLDTSVEKLAVKVQLEGGFFSVGTTVGLKGGGKLEAGLLLTPAILDTESGPALILTSKIVRGEFEAEVVTDGNAKFGDTGMHVASVGINAKGSLATLVDAPKAVVMSTRTDVVAYSGRQSGPWQVEPVNTAISFETAPAEAGFDARGFLLSFRSKLRGHRNLDAEQIRHEQQMAERGNHDADARAQTALAGVSSQRAPGEVTTSVLIAGVEFGPHNDIVKFLAEVLKVGGQVMEAGQQALKNLNYVVQPIAEGGWRIVTAPITAVKDGIRTDPVKIGDTTIIPEIKIRPPW